MHCEITSLQVIGAVFPVGFALIIIHMTACLQHALRSAESKTGLAEFVTTLSGRQALVDIIEFSYLLGYK